MYEGQSSDYLSDLHFSEMRSKGVLFSRWNALMPYNIVCFLSKQMLEIRKCCFASHFEVLLAHFTTLFLHVRDRLCC